VARTASKLKLGYFPLAEQEAKRIRRFLQFRGAASVLDPCAGTGSALRTITDGVEARRYGIEIDAYRAAEAKQVLDEVIQGSVFETHSAVESYGLLYLKLPYLSDCFRMFDLNSSFVSAPARARGAIYGSAREFDEARILGCFLENHKFGPGGRHALGLQQQVAKVLVAATAAEQ